MNSTTNPFRSMIYLKSLSEQLNQQELGRIIKEKYFKDK